MAENDKCDIDLPAYMTEAEVHNLLMALRGGVLQRFTPARELKGLEAMAGRALLARMRPTATKQ